MELWVQTRASCIRKGSAMLSRLRLITLGEHPEARDAADEVEFEIGVAIVCILVILKKESK
jgi:hypothetical protein